MKKKRTVTSVGNTLVKDQGAEERSIPDEIEQLIDEDEAARRVKLSELKDKIASGRYNVSSEEVARAMIKHAADSQIGGPEIGEQQTADSEEEN